MCQIKQPGHVDVRSVTDRPGLAAATVQLLRREQPERYAILVDQTRLQEAESDAWHQAAEHMYIPFDAELEIHPQDDDFLDKERWDFEQMSPDKYPLLLHYHPLVIYQRWGTYHLRSPHENFDSAVYNREFQQRLRDLGHRPAGGEVPEGVGWNNYRGYVGEMLRVLFPAG